MPQGLRHQRCQGPEEPTPRQLETLAADWANDLADAMANVLANGNTPPIVQLEQLQSHR